MKREELEQEILRQEALIEEEQRCINFCLSNPDECDEGEVEEREKEIDNLIEELENYKEIIMDCLMTNNIMTSNIINKKRNIKS